MNHDSAKQTPSLPSAVIFDMDGVLVDSNPFHLEKWGAFLTQHRIKFNAADLPRLILGQHNETLLRQFLGEQVTPEEIASMTEEMEETFRRTFKVHARPLAGLDVFIQSLKAAGFAMAVASSAPMKNVQFVIDALGFHDDFSLCVSGDDVTHPKPHPEIYLTVAGRLGVAPESCAALEDSYVGIESAKRAGMKCVGVASTFPFDALRAQTGADLVIPSFEEITIEKLRKLFDPVAAER